MSHAWEQNVVGGVEAPLFYLCNGDQYVTNGEFEAGTTGWSNGAASAVLARVADPLTPFGDYALRLTAAGDGAPNEYAYLPCETDEQLRNRTFIVTVWARSNKRGTNAKVEVYCGTPNETHSGTLNDLEADKYKQYTFVFSWYWGQSSTSFHLRFYPRNGATESGYLYIDRLACYEVTNIINGLPHPNREEYRYEKEVQARSVLIDGRVKEYTLGWRFGIFLDYQFLSAQQEVMRAKISEADIIILYPHSDCSYCVTCRYSQNLYLRSYFRDRYLGHEGSLILEGTDVFDKKTQRIIGEAIS